MSNSEELALVLDPERKRAGWWGRGDQCPQCKTVHPSIGTWFCTKCGYSQKCADRFPVVIRCTPPPLATDDLAAFTWVLPVLRKAGCVVTLGKHNYTDICLEADGESPPDFCGNTSFARICAMAFSYLAANEPERLAKAVGEVAA